MGIISNFFNHTSSPEQEEQLLRWLEEDSSHLKELKKERKLYDILLMADEPTKSYTVPKNYALKMWKQVVGYAAIILAVFSLGYLFSNKYNEQKKDAFTVIEVPAGQRANITLTDGSHISLNSLSRLRYPQYFDGDLREVELEGEGYFKVKHDSKHPFVVHTHRCSISVLGTEFNIRTQFEKNPFIISLIKGSVLLHDQMQLEKDLLMKPNQQVILEKNHFKIGQIPEYEDFSWREGILNFHNESFENLIKTFESTYGVNFVNLMHKTPTNTNYTGKILIDEGIDHALWVLSRNANFDYFRDNIDHSTIYLQNK